MDHSLVELLGLEDVSHAVYRKSSLVLALCQVRFNPILSIANPASVAPFQLAIQDLYLMTAPPPPPIAVQFAPGVPVQVQQPIAGGPWIFTDADDNWRLVLAQDAISLETRVYQSFSDFLERLRHVLTALVQHIQPVVVTRVGLRYINEIRSDDKDRLASFISQELLGPLSVSQFQAGAVQSMQELLLRYEGGYGINIRHGLLPNGTTVQPRNGEEVSRVPFYLLDFDAFVELAKPRGVPLDIDTVCEQVRDFNRTNYRLFRWSVTDQYESTLEVVRYATD